MVAALPPRSRLHLHGELTAILDTDAARHGDKTHLRLLHAEALCTGHQGPEAAHGTRPGRLYVPAGCNWPETLQEQGTVERGDGVVSDVGTEVGLVVGAEVALLVCTEVELIVGTEVVLLVCTGVALVVGAEVVLLVCTEVALDVASWKVVPVCTVTLTLEVLVTVTVGGGQCSRGSQHSTLIW